MSWPARLWRWICLWFPFGVLWPNKPRHYREMLRVAWINRGRWGYAWRILRHGVCDGCSLGPRGLRDDVIPGIHVCLTRLGLLELNTLRPMAAGVWEEAAALEKLGNRGLQALGRLPYPLLRRNGDKGFKRISWEEAETLSAQALREVKPERMGFFATSRGLYNEAYYAFQKLARAAGTNNVDSCARLCHAASVAGLKDTIGVGAPTIELKDFIGADLVIMFGTNLPYNQPVSTKYLHYARQAGTRFLVVNPAREPLLDRYWVPSVPMSALFGTVLCDDFFGVRVGGDIAFIHGVLKELIARGALDEAFIREHTEGFETLVAHVNGLSWAEVEAGAGLPRAEMARFADWYAKAKTAVIVYSMGLTQHRFGVDNVKAVVNLALSRGMIGRPKCGILPIRGHSGVQGTSEVGLDPDKYCTGEPVGPEAARKLGELWKTEVPTTKGLRAAHVIEAAGQGGIDLLYSVGGNYLETLPDPDYVRGALGQIKYRIHQDIVLNNQQLVPPALPDGWLLLLPAATRYETPGGITATSTERRIRYSPEIPGPRVGEAKPEWEIPNSNRPTRFRRTPLRLRDHTRNSRRDGAHRAAVPGHPGAEGRGPMGPVGRTPALRGGEVQDQLGQGALLGAAVPARRRPGGALLPDDQARQAVQQHRPAQLRLDDWESAAQHGVLLGGRRRSAGAAGGRRGAAAVHDRGVCRQLPGGADPGGHAAGLLARVQRAARAPLRSGLGRAGLRRPGVGGARLCRGRLEVTPLRRPPGRPTDRSRTPGRRPWARGSASA